MRGLPARTPSSGITWASRLTICKLQNITSLKEYKKMLINRLAWGRILCIQASNNSRILLQLAILKCCEVWSKWADSNYRPTNANTPLLPPSEEKRSKHRQNLPPPPDKFDRVIKAIWENNIWKNNSQKYHVLISWDEGRDCSIQVGVLTQGTLYSIRCPWLWNWKVILVCWRALMQS